MPSSWQHGHLRDDATGALVGTATPTKVGGGFALGGSDETAMAPGAGSYQSGFVRVAGFGAVCTAAGGLEWRGGFLVDAAGAVAVVTAAASLPPLRWQAGYLRDDGGRLVVN